MDQSPKSWLDRLLGTATLLMVVALLVHWGWALLRPVLPVLIGAGVLVIVSILVIRYRRNRYW